MAARKVEKDKFADLRKICVNGKRSIDELELQIGDAKVLKSYIQMGRYAVEEIFEPFLVAEISQNGDPQRVSVKLKADET